VKLALEASKDPQFIKLSVAENNSMWEDWLAPKIKQIFASAVTEPADQFCCFSKLWAAYSDMRGTLRFRQAMAQLVERYFFHRSVDPDMLVCAAGSGSLIDMLADTVCDPGDGVLIPTPAYAGFIGDVSWRAQCVPVFAHHTNCDEDFALRLDIFEAARRASPVPVRMCLLCSPSNPIAQLIPADTIRQFVEWANEHEIHLIVDEIYGASVYRDEDQFASVGALYKRLGPYVHFVWGASKDMCLHSFRVGVLYSENEVLRKSVTSATYFAAVSGMTQYVLSVMLEDIPWCDAFFAESRSRILAQASYMATLAEEHGIRMLRPQAGLFAMLDLRKYMDKRGRYPDLWERLIRDAKVNMTPGTAMRMLKDGDGWFRCCFMNVSPEQLREAFRRIGAVIHDGNLELEQSTSSVIVSKL
jgi:aspartate/methionine/tyrosine aminotransferase